MTRRLSHWLTFVVVCLAMTRVTACEIRVRDSAFRIQRDVHRLCVIADAADDSAGEIVSQLEQWLEEVEGAINLEVVRVDADDAETNWQSLGIPSAPPALPVTVLIGRNNGRGESFIIDHWDPAPTAEEFTAIIDSPLRQNLAGQLTGNVAVLLFAPSDPTADSHIAGQMRSLVESGFADERIGLSMLTLDRSDPAEQLLCRFMGLRRDSPDTLCVAFGRGKLMFPPLVGDEINSGNVTAMVSKIRQACSCSEPLQTMGVDIPLVWTDAIDATVLLMDDEIELDQLDAEVQNMLAAKATNDVVGDPTVVAIPPGDRVTSQGSLPAIEVAPTTTVPTTYVVLGFLVVLGSALALVLARRWYRV